MIRSVLLGALLSAPALAISPQPVSHAPAAVLDGVAVQAPSSVPVWELRRGDDRLLVLSDFYPRRISEDTHIDAAEVAALASQADALVYGPGVLADDSVSVFKGMFMWRAYRKATRLPDGQTLEAVLDPELYARWSENKARFMPRNRSVEKMRPAYAAYELHKAALKFYGVHSAASVREALYEAFEDREDERIDARYRLDVSASRADIKAFELDDASATACLARTLENLRGSLESSVVGADAWDSGDMQALRAYFEQTPSVDRCWEHLINQRTAALMGLPDPYAQAPEHWLSMLDKAFDAHDTLITYLPARTVLTESGVIASLKDQGWIISRRP